MDHEVVLLSSEEGTDFILNWSDFQLINNSYAFEHLPLLYDWVNSIISFPFVLAGVRSRIITLHNLMKIITSYLPL